MLLYKQQQSTHWHSAQYVAIHTGTELNDRVGNGPPIIDMEGSGKGFSMPRRGK